MSPIVGIIGTIQALEAIKLIANFGRPKEGMLLLMDGMTMSWQELKVSKQSNCIVCSETL